MRKRQLARALFFPFLLAAVLDGCQSFQSYRPMAILVRDAETKQPISGAEVHVWYPLRRDSTGPKEATAPTTADGIARLQASPNEDAGMTVEANARGYMFTEVSVPIETVRELKPVSHVHTQVPPPASVVLELYAEPHPSVELIVPNGYRGIVRA